MRGGKNVYVYGLGEIKQFIHRKIELEAIFENWQMAAMLAPFVNPVPGM